MRTAPLLWIGLALVLAGCAGTGSDQPGPTGPVSKVMPGIPNGTVRLILLGDVGTGDEDQVHVAQGVQKVCAAKGCTVVLMAGDNIYGAGASSDHDPQFESKFETPYKDIDLPFYLVLGNHDNGDGNGAQPEQGDHEVEYQLRTDRMSDKWHMPGRYYSVTFGDVQIFGLDSGPMEVAQTPVWLPQSRGATMQTWLTNELAKSTAQWKLAFAHHPYVSNSAHGNAGSFDGVAGRGLGYKNMLENTICGKVPVFMAGHDHNLQWLQPVQACGGTEFMVSGAGGADLYAKDIKPTHPLDPAYFEDYTHHGFFWIDITGDKFTGVAYDNDGHVLFERSFTKKAEAAPLPGLIPRP